MLDPVSGFEYPDAWVRKSPVSRQTHARGTGPCGPDLVRHRSGPGFYDRHDRSCRIQGRGPFPVRYCKISPSQDPVRPCCRCSGGRTRGAGIRQEMWGGLSFGCHRRNGICCGCSFLFHGYQLCIWRWHRQVLAGHPPVKGNPRSEPAARSNACTLRSGKRLRAAGSRGPGDSLYPGRTGRCTAEPEPAYRRRRGYLRPRDYRARRTVGRPPHRVGNRPGCSGGPTRYRHTGGSAALCPPPLPGTGT